MADVYEEALVYLYGLAPRGIRLELDRVEEALSRRGDPHRGLAFVHVAGSNGKGSVSASIERALRDAGHRTGLYTSPHLHRFVERIRVNGEPIAEGELAAKVASLRAASLPPLTFFEHATLIAFEAFRDAEVDVVVLEVGLGGRLDATNVVTPRATVITNVSLEHQRFLGERLEEIAFEKAGVLKPGVPAVTGARDVAVLEVLERRAHLVGAPLAVAGSDFSLRRDRAPFRFSWPARGYELAIDSVGAEGPWAAENAELAVAALHLLRDAGFAIPDGAIRSGLASSRWPGRFETIERQADRPAVLLDAAHNPAGCEALARSLSRTGEGSRDVLLFGALDDKDHRAMLAAFDGIAAERVYALPSMARAGDPRVFTESRPGHVAASVQEGLARACALAGPSGRVIVCGSIFLMAEARAQLLGLDEDPKIAL